MPKMSEIKNKKRKSTENRDESMNNKIEEEVYYDESKGTFKGIGHNCLKEEENGHNCLKEEENAPEDLDILVTNFAKSFAAKKRKNDVEAENCINAAMKNLGDSMKKQEMDRKGARMTLQRSLVSVMRQMESDSTSIKESNQQLQQIFRSHQKLALRIEEANAQRVQALSEINENYSKLCEVMDIQQRDDANQAQAELAAKFKKLQEKLISDYRRKSAEAWKRAYANFY